MATLTVQQLAVSGIAPTYGAADALGDSIPYSTDVFIHVKNGDTVAHTVSVVSQLTASPGVAPTNVDVSIAAGADKLIGPFKSIFKTGSNTVEVTYDAVTSVTVAAIRP